MVFGAIASGTFWPWRTGRRRLCAALALRRARLRLPGRPRGGIRSRTRSQGQRGL